MIMRMRMIIADTIHWLKRSYVKAFVSCFVLPLPQSWVTTSRAPGSKELYVPDVDVTQTKMKLRFYLCIFHLIVLAYSIYSVKRRASNNGMPGLQGGVLNKPLKYLLDVL